MLVDPKGLGKPPVFSGTEEDFYVWAKKVENYVSGVFLNVRGALSFAVESQDVVTATAVALAVAELEAETSAEIDGQLFVVLSALTDRRAGASCTEGGTRSRAGRARSLLRKILSPSRVTLPEFVGAIERMEDLVRRFCSRRDAQGNEHNLAEDNSHEFT